MELISREDAKRKITEELDSIDHVPGWVFRRLERVISSLPTIEERKEGHWIELQQNDDGTHNIQCSVCRFCFKSKGHARSYNTKKHYVFCPHCGSYMKGE